MILQPLGEAPSLAGRDPARRTPDGVPDGRISGAPARAAKGRHLRAALAAVVLVALALAGGASYADRTETRYIHALAPDLSQQKGLGSALPIAAFRQPDLLPVYGSSELDHYLGPYHASELFRTYPSGFTIFPIRKDGTAALTLLQDLAGVGPDLRGKKLVISLSLTWFIFGDAASPEYYAGNFSRLHAGQLAFSTDLSLDLKHDAATRMLQFPATLEQDPLLKLGLVQANLGSLTFITGDGAKDPAFLSEAGAAGKDTITARVVEVDGEKKIAFDAGNANAAEQPLVAAAGPENKG